MQMVCPFAKCQALHSLNAPSNVKAFYSGKLAHLKVKHGDDPIGKRLIKRWEAVHGDGGGVLLSAEDLDAREGCELKLQDKAWLEANLGDASTPLENLRGSPSDHTAHFDLSIANNEAARSEWLDAKKSVSAD
jgi:hypothetical protein